MYLENDDKEKLIETDSGISAFFLGNETMRIYLEDGRMVEIDRYGQYTLYWYNDKVLDTGTFKG